MAITHHAYAKINLCLQLTGKRADGYHLLESLVVFADVGDVITVHTSDQLSLTITGPHAAVLQQEDPERNLVMRAARGLAEKAGISPAAAITLEKHLPIGSGIGGGSSDAAATLRTLNQLWTLDYDDATLANIALSLGADVPICLHQRTAIMRGVGEQISPANIPEGLCLLLVNPRISLATSAVFSALQLTEFSGALPEYTPAHFFDWLCYTRNDLESAAQRLCPQISHLLSAIAATDDCLLARMSGSGATCFGLFNDSVTAQKALANIKSTFPHYWIFTAAILP